MNRDEALDLLRTNKPALAERFGVTGLALFGSFARDQATDSSDVDILVEFAAPPDWKAYFGVVSYLEDILGRPVDVATISEVRKEIRPFVERDAVMFDSREQERPWSFYVQDMLDFAETVLGYTSGLDMDAFVADRRTYDATLRNIQLIGEAANHVPDDVREAYPSIPWYAMIGTRNRLAHAYLHISDAILWSIIQDAIPGLVPQLRKLLEDVRRESP